MPNAAFPLELNNNINNNNNSTHPYTNIHGNNGSEPSITHTNTTNTDTVMIDDTTVNNSNPNNTNNTIQPTNEGGVFFVPGVSTGLMQLNNNTNGFTREGAMEAFLGKTEARAVVGAAEPYLLLFSNQVCVVDVMLKTVSFSKVVFSGQWDIISNLL